MRTLQYNPEVLVEAIGAAVDSPCRGANR